MAADPCHGARRVHRPGREWVVMLAGREPRWGGELQRSRVFRRLAERTQAAVIDGFGPGAVRRGLGAAAYRPLPLRWPWGKHRPLLAASDPLRPDVLWAMGHHADPAALAYYDDPLEQTRALGIRLAPVRERLLRFKRSQNLRAFAWHVVPSGSFAELVGLPSERVIVGGNGTDTNRVRPGAWPEQPTVGMVSGAAPGRGIETLIAAAGLAREREPGLQLSLWLTATGAGTAAYLASLEASVSGQGWVRIESVPYEGLGAALSRATVLCIPHPPGDYMDVALPVKLFDSMAAGRPVVVTPRAETRRVIERHGAGLVSRGETAEDLADALLTVLTDRAMAMRLGAAARRAAELEYDWDIIGDRIADEVLGRDPAGVTR